MYKCQEPALVNPILDNMTAYNEWWQALYQCWPMNI